MLFAVGGGVGFVARRARAGLCSLRAQIMVCARLPTALIAIGGWADLFRGRPFRQHRQLPRCIDYKGQALVFVIQILGILSRQHMANRLDTTKLNKINDMGLPASRQLYPLWEHTGILAM